MKPTYLPLGLALVIFFFTGCQKNDNQSTSANNFFKVEDQRHSIEKAAYVTLEGNPILENMKALLFNSDGISFDANSNRELIIKGKGKLMGFIIYGKKNDGLDNGDHFINLRPPFMEGDVALGFYDLNWDEKDGLIRYEENDGPSILAGKVTVLHKQDVVDLIFNFTTEHGKILTGQYNGPLQMNLIYRTEQIKFDN